MLGCSHGTEEIDRPAWEECAVILRLQMTERSNRSRAVSEPHSPSLKKIGNNAGLDREFIDWEHYLRLLLELMTTRTHQLSFNQNQEPVAQPHCPPATCG